MHKKICILNGSPRINGNTKELIKYFTKGAETVGHEVTCFDLQKMNIHAVLVVVMEVKTKTPLVYKKMICRKSILYTRQQTS